MNGSTIPRAQNTPYVLEYHLTFKEFIIYATPSSWILFKRHEILSLLATFNVLCLSTHYIREKSCGEPNKISISPAIRRHT